MISLKMDTCANSSLYSMTMDGLIQLIPKRMAATIQETNTTNSNLNNAKIRTETYLDKRICARDIGRLKSSLMVPHRNSCATMPAATMIVKRLTTDSKKTFSRTYSQAS